MAWPGSGCCSVSGSGSMTLYWIFPDCKPFAINGQWSWSAKTKSYNEKEPTELWLGFKLAVPLQLHWARRYSSTAH